MREPKAEKPAITQSRPPRHQSNRQDHQLPRRTLAQCGTSLVGCSRILCSAIWLPVSYGFCEKPSCPVCGDHTPSLHRLTLLFATRSGELKVRERRRWALIATNSMRVGEKPEMKTGPFRDGTRTLRISVLCSPRSTLTGSRHSCIESTISKVSPKELRVPFAHVDLHREKTPPIDHFTPPFSDQNETLSGNFPQEYSRHARAQVSSKYSP